MELLIFNHEPEYVDLMTEELRHKDLSINIGEEKDIGCGADWHFLEIAIVAISGIFFMGKEIEDNLKSWINIGKILNDFLDKHKGKTPIFIDKDAATALAISAIQKKEKTITSLKLISIQELGGEKLNKIYRDGRNKNTLASMPYNYYILTFEVNNKKYIFGIKSNGEIRYKDVFSGNTEEYENCWDTLGK